MKYMDILSFDTTYSKIDLHRRDTNFHAFSDMIGVFGTVISKKESTDKCVYILRSDFPRENVLRVYFTSKNYDHCDHQSFEQLNGEIKIGNKYSFLGQPALTKKGKLYLLCKNILPNQTHVYDNPIESKSVHLSCIPMTIDFKTIHYFGEDLTIDWIDLTLPGRIVMETLFGNFVFTQNNCNYFTITVPRNKYEKKDYTVTLEDNDYFESILEVISTFQ